MANSRLDAIAAILAKASGRSEVELLVSLKSVWVPQMKDPSGLQEEISEEEFQRLSAIGDHERAGIINWMLAGMWDPSPFPNN